MKVCSLADAQYFAEKLNRYLRKLNHDVPMHQCYDMIAWANKHKSWQAFKPHLEELGRKRAGMLERMAQSANQSFGAYLASLDFNDDKNVHWQHSEELQKFVESYVVATEVSLNSQKDLNNLRSLCCKLSQSTDEKIKELLLNNTGFYFEIDPYGSLSIFDLYVPASQDRRIRNVLVFLSDLPEEEFLEDFKSKLIKKACEVEAPTQKFLGMLADATNSTSGN